MQQKYTLNGSVNFDADAILLGRNERQYTHNT